MTIPAQSALYSNNFIESPLNPRSSRPQKSFSFEFHEFLINCQKTEGIWNFSNKSSELITFSVAK